MVGKRFLGKFANRFCRYPGGNKFCQNCSILYCFRDKCIFGFMHKFKMAAKNGEKLIFGKSRH